MPYFVSAEEKDWLPVHPSPLCVLADVTQASNECLLVFFFFIFFALPPNPVFVQTWHAPVPLARHVGNSSSNQRQRCKTVCLKLQHLRHLAARPASLSGLASSRFVWIRGSSSVTGNIMYFWKRGEKTAELVWRRRRRSWRTLPLF